MTRLRDTFTEHVAAGDACELARGALLIARIAYPDLDPAPSLARLDALARTADAELRGSRDPLALAGWVFGACGFRGNTADYYDPRNSCLNDVLERRTGIPIALAVVLMEVGARRGIAVEGVGFPGHFLVRVQAGTGPRLLDPFAGGRALDGRELLARLRAYYEAGGGPPGSNLQRVLPQALQASGRTAILGRMLGNLLHVYVRRSDPRRALAAADLLLVLTPDAPEPLRMRGLLYAQLECHGSALADLERYLALAPRGPHAAEVRDRVARLRDAGYTLH